jgi:hypothetical protein
LVRVANPQLATRGSGRLSDQIIIRVADDFHPGKLAQRQLAADIDPAVYVRCVGFAAGDQKTGLERRSVLVSSTNQAVFSVQFTGGFGGRVFLVILSTSGSTRGSPTSSRPTTGPASSREVNLVVPLICVPGDLPQGQIVIWVLSQQTEVIWWVGGCLLPCYRMPKAVQGSGEQGNFPAVLKPLTALALSCGGPIHVATVPAPGKA